MPESGPNSGPNSGHGPVLASWTADRQRYIRDHAFMAAALSVLATGALIVLDNPDPWVGALGACLAIGVRGGYLASEELALTWALTPDALHSSHGKHIALRDLTRVRTFGSAVQLVTRGGDKHLIRYIAAPGAMRDRIAAAAGLAE